MYALLKLIQVLLSGFCWWRSMQLHICLGVTVTWVWISRIILHMLCLVLLLNTARSYLKLILFQTVGRMDILYVMTPLHTKEMVLTPTRAPGSAVPTLGLPLKGVSRPFLMQALTSHTEKQKMLEGWALRTLALWEDLVMVIHWIHPHIAVLVHIILIPDLFKFLKMDLEERALKAPAQSAGLVIVIHQIHHHIAIQVHIQELLNLSEMFHGHHSMSGAAPIQQLTVQFCFSVQLLVTF